jgi:hypothetical protein
MTWIFVGDEKEGWWPSKPYDTDKSMALTQMTNKKTNTQIKKVGAPTLVDFGLAVKLSLKAKDDNFWEPFATLWQLPIDAYVNDVILEKTETIIEL